MTSIYPTLIEDIAGMAVSYTDKNGATITPTVLSINDRMDSVQTAHLPIRLIMAWQQQTGTIGAGGIIDGAWNITDMLLLETSARDMGAHVLRPVMARYQVAWIEKLSRLWRINHGVNAGTITASYTIWAGEYEYPASSGVWFYGVKCSVILQEQF
jgi:hypothetical protein